MRRVNNEPRDYKIVYKYRRRNCKHQDLDARFETVVTAYNLIQATKLAYEEFNPETDYVVVAVSLIRS